MARFHRLELFRRAWRAEGPLAAARLALRHLRDRALGQHRLLFAMTGEKALSRPPASEDGFRIRHFPRWSDVDAPVRAALDAHARHVFWNVESLMAEGAELWVGELDGLPLSIAQSRTGPAMGAYFFPMSDLCAVVSHCVTFPDARGRGFYVRMLTHIDRELARGGVRRLYIDCSDFNFASSRGILAAGYLPIGRGVHRRSGRLVWFQESPPSVCRQEREAR